MCGRFTLRTPAERLVQQFSCVFPADLEPRYNIAPTQAVLAVRCESSSSERRVAPLRWGLIPFWAKEAAIGNRMINARSETVAEKPAFRAAFRRRRCLVPADGYYEWKKEGRQKQPFRIRLRDETPFGIAGLWESWDDPASGQTIESCTILTTEANALTREVHERMPVILPRERYAEWLAPDLEDARCLLPLLQPFPVEPMQMDPVSTLVNNPRNDSSECVVPLEKT
jgi:putative SOS response-associated peptidase YedK